MGGIDWSDLTVGDERHPGLVAAVIEGGEIRDRQSCGAETPGGPPLSTASVLYVASIAKQFTAACVALLVLDGVLGVDDDVRGWIPELPTTWAGVRLVDLLSHTAGLADSVSADAAGGFAVDRACTTAQRMSLVIAAGRPVDRPGLVHRYANHGYVVLASVVERASGRSLGFFAAERIFGPLGMSRTRFLDVPGPPIVPGWAADGGRVDIAFSCVGDGGLVTCIDDLARWDGWLPTSRLAPRLLSGRPVLPDGTWAHDAWGISIRTHHGLRIESHGGAIDGYLASYVRFPELGTSIVVLANTDRWGVEAFGAMVRSFADRLLADRLDLSLPGWDVTHGVPVE
ncbi:MAG TPA: serine hydrolase domain-containing protein [Acidimicrobiales bacterium]